MYVCGVKQILATNSQPLDEFSPHDGFLYFALTFPGLYLKGWLIELFNRII